MNLNKYDREAFVRAVMDDVPHTASGRPGQRHEVWPDWVR